LLDLHTHVLPGIDDGPPDSEGSRALIEEAVAAGTTTVVATPHLRHDFPLVRPGELASRCSALERLLPSSCSVKLVSGAEVDLMWAQSASPAELRMASYAQQGSDLLIETPYGPLGPAFEERLFHVTAQGFRALLAHPERNPSFQATPGRLAALVRRGVLVQVTASALGLPRRSRTGRLARALIREELAHVLASDAHSADSARGAGLTNGLRMASEIEPARARWMVSLAPAAVIAGESLPAVPGKQLAARRPWGRRIARLRLGRTEAENHEQ
jgi:protein-tyrosine phosphatase